ncbi:MAG: hypothetical protein KGQ41_00630 [Alphaproteobacteria bacterium]|nr:hypothetical protein [Alphaproteobacteria bacterium]
MAQSQNIRTNRIVIWHGMNNRGKPAIAYINDDGAAIVDIFNMRGSVSEVAAMVESRYPKGLARRGIFEKFTTLYSLMPR